MEKVKIIQDWELVERLLKEIEENNNSEED
jgi:hypothetical protein